MANEKMRENWTKYGGPGRIEHQRIFAAVYAPLSAALVARLEPLDGMTVLDVGCGAGGLSAAVVERGGTAIGVDISETVIEGARRLVPEATFVVADAQVADLTDHAPSGFDVVASEFGVMFFDDPVAAFANLAAATRPGGRLAFICWRSITENPAVTLGYHVLEERMPDPPPPVDDDRPGPTGLADAGRTTAMLADAGWSDVTTTPFDAVCHYGIDGSDGVEERMALITSGLTGRLAEQQLRPLLGDDGWSALLDEVRADLRQRVVDGDLAVPCATWIVTARRGTG